MNFPRLIVTHKTRLLDFSTYLMAFSLSMVLVVTFLWAYLFNNNVFSVSINLLGEAHLEFVMLVFMIVPFLVYGLILRCKKIKKEVKKI